MNGYDVIFSGVRSKVELQQAIARAVRQLREAMEKDDNRAVTAAHVRNLADLEPEALAQAYALAEETCTFWPMPGQMRELAGCAEESRGTVALHWVLGYLRKHGPEGRVAGGAAHFGEDETERRVLLRVDPKIPAPAIPADLAETLLLLGCGVVKDGLHYAAQHPVVKGWDAFNGEAASRTAERIEVRWMRCYLQCMRKRRKAADVAAQTQMATHPQMA